MSDVVLSTTESVTTVTVVDDVVQVAVTTNPVTVTTQTAGVQGASYNFGDPIYVTVRNATGATLTKGTIVYTSGAQGNHTLVQKANASSDATSARTLGWVSADIANNADGFVVVEGYLDGIDTDHIAEGSQLYLSTVAGGFTATKPQAPVHLVYVGVVTKSNPGNGRVLVKVQNGYELDELHDVKITSPVNNQVLTYDSATDLWVNATNPADGVTSVTATSPLTGGTITSTGSIGLDQSLLTVTQSQVTGLVTALSGKANLAGGNALTGAQTITGTAAGSAVTSLQAASGQSVNILAILNSAGTDVGGFGNTGNLKVRTAIEFSGALNVAAASSTQIGAVIRGASGQTANLLMLQDNSGNRLAEFSAAGQFATSRISITPNAALSAVSRFFVQTASATDIGAVVRGAAGQTSSLQEWQNSAGTVLASISNSGGLSSLFMQTEFGLAQLGNASNGGTLRLDRATSAIANPGANRGRLYFRDGTNAGTLKLVVRAGAAGVEETLFDNLDQTGTSTIAIGSGVRATDATVATASTGVGYMGLPQNTTTTGSYTIVAADAGEHIYASATRTVTIPANSALALPIGTTLTFIAGAGATMTIAITTDTMYLAGAGTTGSRTLAAHGIATAVKTTATTWIISGNGLT